MTTPDNRALWELVEADREFDAAEKERHALVDGGPKLGQWSDEHYDKVAAACERKMQAAILRQKALKAVEILERPVVVGGWLPIESAPKDGTDILAYENGEIFQCEWDWKKNEWWPLYLPAHGGCMSCVGPNPKPTHWMPLPASPETNESMVRGKS